MWTVAHVTVYSVAGGLTSLLTTLGYPRAEAGIIPAVSTDAQGVTFRRLTAARRRGGG